MRTLGPELLNDVTRAIEFTTSRNQASENISTAPEVSAAIISAAALVIVAVTGSALSKYVDRRQQIEQEQRQRKAKVYEVFLEYG